MNPVVQSFLFFLLLFTAIGAYSAFKRKATTDDYLLAGRSIGPWFTALSAVATNNSGFMFIGLIGTAYTTGLSSVWIMFGWIVGDYMMWFWIHPRLRTLSEQEGARTIPSVLGYGLKGGVRSIAAVITILFLGSYAAAQLTAGSKALHVLLGWDYAVGAIVGAAIVLIYCFAGGIRASIWTDVAQSVVMFASILLLFVIALEEVGGWSALWAKLEAIDPQLTRWTPPEARFGFLLYALGWFGAGFGVIGQPHIMVRAMAARSEQDLRLARHIYFVWYVIFAAACIGVALTCRVLLPDMGLFDAELALPTLAGRYLPAVLVGLVMAGLFAATMSTADSQVLSCSAALTQDLFPAWSESYGKAKLGTAVVTLVILGIALKAESSVFALVTMSWSVLAAGLGPLMIVRVGGMRVTAPLAAAMMLSGVAAVFLWNNVLGLSGDVFETLPGMLTGLAVYFAARPRGRRR